MTKTILSPSDMLAEAEKAASSGKFKIAIKHLKNYLKLATNSEALALLADLYEKTDDDFGAADTWRKACELSDDPSHYFRLARVRNRQLLHKDAVKVLDEALCSHPFNIKLHEEKVRTLHEMRSPDLATAASELYKVDPNSVLAISHFGKAMLLAGHLEEAEARISQALSMEPNNPWTILFLAELRIEQMQFRSALELLVSAYNLFDKENNENQKNFIAYLYRHYEESANAAERKVKHGHLSAEEQLGELINCGVRLIDGFNLNMLLNHTNGDARSRFEADPFLSLLSDLVSTHSVVNADVFNCEAIDQDGDYVRFLEMFKRIASSKFPLQECRTK